MKKTIIEYAVCTDVGRKRKNNEDNYYCNGEIKEDASEPKHHLTGSCEISAENGHFTCAVCDGMGGLDAGEEASLIAAKKLREHDGIHFEENIEQYYQEANIAVLDRIEDWNIERMGTTAVILHINSENMVIGNLGDSRCYLFRNNKLSQITKDHTRAQQMVDAGILEKNDMKQSRQSHVLTQYIGVPRSEFIVEPTIINNLKAIAGDIFVLCSDGLSDMIDEDEMESLIKATAKESAEAISSNLKDVAIENGGKDNVTVAVAKVL